MSPNLFLIILLSVAYTKAQDNQLCECKTEQDVKDNEDLWALLKQLEKLSSEAPEKQKIDYALLPGSLYELGCKCDEKLRKRRNVDPEQPEEVDSKKVQDDVEEVREKRNVIHPKFSQFGIDLRCPKGTYWIAQAHTCVPIENFEENESEEQ